MGYSGRSTSQILVNMGGDGRIYDQEDLGGKHFLPRSKKKVTERWHTPAYWVRGWEPRRELRWWGKVGKDRQERGGKGTKGASNARWGINLDDV